MEVEIIIEHEAGIEVGSVVAVALDIGKDDVE